MHLRAPAPGTRSFILAIVVAQVLTQIGAFALPALLPSYIERWHLSKIEAGWLVGIFFAAYVVTVPVLLALTDRLPARRVYLLGATFTAASHLGFALLADGFWSALMLRVMVSIGWAGGPQGHRRSARRHRPIARRLDARGGSGAGGSRFVRRCRPVQRAGRAGGRVSIRGGRRRRSLRHRRAGDAARPGEPRRCSRSPGAPRLPAGVPQSRCDGMDRRVHGAHLGARGPASLGRHLSCRDDRAARRPDLVAQSDTAVHPRRACRHRDLDHRQ